MEKEQKKIWIVTVECPEMSPSFTIDGVYSTKQKAEKARETLYRENPEMDLDIDITETVIY